jgi:biotin carboxylase
MAPVTLQRFMKELDKIKQESMEGVLQPENYDSRLARVISELKERGLDADRAAATAALADAVTRGVITTDTQSHLQNRLGLTA